MRQKVLLVDKSTFRWMVMGTIFQLPELSLVGVHALVSEAYSFRASLTKTEDLSHFT